MFTKKFRKYLSLGIILLVIFTRVMGPVSILAQEADTTPTPTEEPSPTPTPTDLTTTSEEPTPTPTLDPTSVEATNSAELNNNVNSDANTGENTATQSGELTDETNTK